MAESNICEVHRVPLKERTVPVRYGFPAYDAALDVQDVLFPHSHSYALGGCVVDDEPAPPYKMPVCLECRKAEKAWRAEHDPANGSRLEGSLFDITARDN